MVNIKITSPKLNYDLDIRHKATVIIGESATGKSTLANLITRSKSSKRVTIECIYPVEVITSTSLLEASLKVGARTIYIIDEYSINKEFLELFKEATNAYFILITRDVIESINYSVDCVCRMIKEGKNHHLEYITIENRCKDIFSTVKYVLTEDKGKGFKWVQNVYKNKITKSAEVDKSGIIDKIKELLTLNDGDIYVFFDMGGFGCYYQTLLEFLDNYKGSYRVYFNTDYNCFEHMLCCSNIVKDGKEITEEEDLDSTSIENAWEKRLKRLTTDTPYYINHDSDTPLPVCYYMVCCPLSQGARVKVGRCNGRLIGSNNKLTAMFNGTIFENLIDVAR